MSDSSSMQQPVIPVAVLHTQDGRTIATRMERDPDMDRPEGHPRGAITWWKAIPVEPVERGTYEVEVTYGPPGHGFNVEVPSIGPDAYHIQGQPQ